MSSDDVQCEGESGTCENTARYINSLGQGLCGLCDIKSPLPSIRVSDLPQLISKLDLLFEYARTADSGTPQPQYTTLPQIGVVANIKELLCLKKR